MQYLEEDEYNKSCLINDSLSEPISLARISIVLKTIFQKEFDKNNLIIKEMFIHLKDKIENIKSYEHVIEILKEYVNNNYLSNKEHILDKINKYEQQAIENRIVFIPNHRENPNSIYWPNPDIYQDFPYVTKQEIFNKNTIIGTSGSCVARDLGLKLFENGFSMVSPKEAYTENDNYNVSSSWGIIFNSGSLKNVIEKAFGTIKIPKLLNSMKKNRKIAYSDPFRNDIFFDSIQEYEDGYERHTSSLKNDLLSIEICIIILESNEVWTLKTDDQIFASRSIIFRGGSDLFEPRVLTIEENVQNLQKMLDIWLKHNPKIKIIIGVSPMALTHTFRGNTHHIANATEHSKAVLKLAVEEFVQKNDNVFYLPAYEMVKYFTKDAWHQDGKSLSDNSKENIYKLLINNFYANNTKNY
ncbi:MAG: GSCFA domain-containing protein [Candidatus Sericytochromatia bacterium]|nr:GSCFA domain-containing protein [Candidatus Sericytochromatia bacterium]